MVADNELPLFRTHNGRHMAGRNERIEAGPLGLEQHGDRRPSEPPATRRRRFLGRLCLISAATGANVVSKPATTKNTIDLFGLSRAMAAASIGLAMGLTSAPRTLACSSDLGGLWAH